MLVRTRDRARSPARTMPSKYEQFDRSRLLIGRLSERRHLVNLGDVLELGEAPMPFEHPSLPPVADAVVRAVQRGAAVVLMMGAHVIKQGLSRYVCDLIRRRWVSVVATSGAGPMTAVPKQSTTPPSSLSRMRAKMRKSR